MIKRALERSGVPHKFVSGWETRGSDAFSPVGMTWHATAGSATSTAQAEVNVLLTGSATAPAPIAQFMAARDGVLWVVAAGKCNHNKVGWDGPNEGLGNTNLWGIEIHNDNRGQAYPAAQLKTVRRFTAALFEQMKADPRRRLAGHYEHQPYATRPAGEGSTKSDPYGIKMVDERALVYKIMREELGMDPKEFVSELLNTELGDPMTAGESHKVGDYIRYNRLDTRREIETALTKILTDADKTQSAIEALAAQLAEIKALLTESDDDGVEPGTGDQPA